ncbi:MAG TPA: aminotransferase class V-fold PLP-dependent enzyme [Clostridia bacterium]|nr:aminotransferase class V-fold PLP-dependent enzyme [Clostridia bacterium]
MAMIYLDNAASSWPKPPGVIRRMGEVLQNNTSNPGRATHQLAMAAGKIILGTRERLALLFNIQEPNRIVFGLNATQALNQAIKGNLQPGDHVVTSSMEHNSVMRPLAVMQSRGVAVTVVPADKSGQLNPSLVKKAIRPATRMMVMTHASNVTGTILPVEELGWLARQHGLTFLVDAAQTAGVLPIDVEKMHIDLLAFPGHKGLLGPQGTGGLYIAPHLELSTLMEGGTGSRGDLLEQPATLPYRHESGTPNTVGLAGLEAAVEFIQATGLEKIRWHEQKLTELARAGLEEIEGITLYAPVEGAKQVGVISFNLSGKDPGEVGYLLDKIYLIAVRTGLHCAPAAHRTLGTLDRGTVRASFSCFNTEEEVKILVESVREIRNLAG